MFTDRRATLNMDIAHQLRSLFGKAPNVHTRLNLGNIVELHYVQKMLSGVPVPERCERVLLARWAEWRATFLADPCTAPGLLDAERTSRERGAFYHPEARDPITEKLYDRDLEPYTLLPDAAKMQ